MFQEKRLMISCATDVGNLKSVEETMQEIRNMCNGWSGCISVPDIIVNCAGKLPKACLTTSLPVS